jgi:hypothetical protein
MISVVSFTLGISTAAAQTDQSPFSQENPK